MAGPEDSRNTPLSVQGDVLEVLPFYPDATGT